MTLGSRDEDRDPGLDEATQTPLDGRAARGADADRQQEQRERQDDVDEPRDEGVQLAAAEPGDQSKSDPDDEGDPGREDRDQQGRPRTVERPDEDVATESVDPEIRDLARTQ